MNTTNGRCLFDTETHRYFLDTVEIPGVSQILALGGLEPAFHVDAATLALAAQRGTYVHEATAIDDRHVYANGPRLDMATVDPACLPYVRAWRSFRVAEPFVPDPDGIEELVWSETERFAGTLDRRGTWKGKPAIVDLKTGRELRWTMGVQLAGYAVGHVDRLGAEHPGATVLAAQGYVRLLVHLHDDGSYDVYASDEPKGRAYLDPADVETFLAALTIAHRKLARPRAALPVVASETADLEVA